MAETVEQRDCNVCGRPLRPNRRGKIVGHVCGGCRVRKHRGAELEGACFCGHADRRVLTWKEFLDGRKVVCANHAAIAGRRPLTYEALAEECGEAIKSEI